MSIFHAAGEEPPNPTNPPNPYDCARKLLVNTTDLSASRAATTKPDTSPPPIPSRPVTCPEPMDTLHHAYSALLSIQLRRLGRGTREQLEPLCAMLARLLRRDASASRRCASDAAPRAQKGFAVSRRKLH
jgi:hypothetical protein